MSDDSIFEPSKSRLKSAGILPEKLGWFPEKTNDEIDTAILGMDARIDNPELIKAQKIRSFSYIISRVSLSAVYNKTRVVIGGSHGKTTITSMVLHVLNLMNIDCDYMG